MTVASLAVATLRELAMLAKPTRVERDAAIQRFEYSFEATWKAAQRFLQIVEGIEVGSRSRSSVASRAISRPSKPGCGR